MWGQDSGGEEESELELWMGLSSPVARPLSVSPTGRTDWRTYVMKTDRDYR